MNAFILLFGTILVSVVHLAPLENNDNKATILKLENNDFGKGNHEFSYGLSNNMTRYERWYVKNAGTPNEVVVVEGHYSYIDPDGKKVSVYYIADEDGYRALPEEVPPDRFAEDQPPTSTPVIPPGVLASLLSG